MASTSALQFSRVLLLLTFALLLLQCVVKCVDVGNGHSLKGSEVEVLKLEAKSLCDFDTDQKGDIMIKYKKGSTSSTSGCVLDLLTKFPLKDGKLVMEVGVTNNDGSLDKCLSDAGIKDAIDVEREYVGDDNMLPFSFSLKGKEEAGAERTDETDYCKDHGKCVESKRQGKCLKKTEYAVAFGLRGKAIMNFVEPLGEPRMWYCARQAEASVPKSANFQIELPLDNQNWTTKKTGCGSDLSFNGDPKGICLSEKSFRKPEFWEIKDPTFADKEYTRLFALHILPQSKVHKHKGGPQKILWGENLDGKETPKCEMYIKLDKNKFKLLRDAPRTTTTPDTPPATETTKNTPTSTVTVPTKAASGGKGVIIAVVVVCLLILLSVVGGIIFFVLRGKKEEEEVMPGGATGYFGTAAKTKTVAGTTTVGATQAKSGMTMTAGGTKTGATSYGGATTTKGGATSKAGGTTTKGAATFKTGGATTKK
ncbi:unnamed protein product [Meloidogyne enterolobii]|uniref:Uncharacterized protein n=1 Tax=Meloidogyne enterolobii TaxID=390850 RepID=A0ACB0Z7V7_MELEN